MEAQAEAVRRISQAPSARNLKPRRVSAVRRWPPGCGRSPSPPPSVQPPSCSSPVSLTATAARSAGKDDTALASDSPHNPLSPSSAANPPPPPPPPPEGKFHNGESIVDAPNGDLSPHTHQNDNDNHTGCFTNKRWMNSKVFPPPKRRSVSATRRYPPGCGRDPDFCLGLIDRPLQTQTSHKINRQNNHTENQNQNQKQNLDDHMSREVGVPIQDDENYASLEGGNADGALQASVQSAPDDVSKSKFQELLVHKKEDSMENSEIAEPNPGELVTTEEETLVNGATAEPDVAGGATIQKPNIEGLSEKAMKIKEKKQPKPEQIATNNDGGPDAEIGVNIETRQSKEIPVFSESVPQMGKIVSSKGKEKKVLRKKIVAKKNVSPKSGRKRDGDAIGPEKDTWLVPFQISNDEDAAMDLCTSEAIVLSQMHPDVCTKMLVAGPSQPFRTEGKTKKKGRRVAKKSIRPIKDDSPSTQRPNLMTLNLLPVAPSDGERLSSARSKVKKILRLFQVVCRVLLRKEESGSGKQPQNDETGSQSKPKGSNRIDLKAADIVKKSSEYIGLGNPAVGHLHGVEVGDEFRYRVELHLVGLHRPLQSGIDWTKINGVPVAISIVASGGYSDGMEGSDVLNYTGSGGKPTGRKGQRTKPEDQKLEKGNLALKNSMDMKTPVRVIHGLNTSDTNKVVMTFIYDGLYMVEEFKPETETYKIDGQEYKAQVFRYKLRRMPGQSELGLHLATKTKKSKVREGLCVPDISQGKEKIPICAINTIDDEKPPTFKYITSMIYPSWYEKNAPNGCDCSGKCTSSKRCLCALKNGGEIPFNFNGAIVQAKQLIYECGPSCRCPPSCHNRVSQTGIKIPLEIFKTENRGWGVRSLSSIPSGSFVCEYVGELLRDEEADRRSNDEYLFDIGHNYDDAALWEGLPSLVPGIRLACAAENGASASEGLTIDAAEMGNVGRFINHCCSPNLYAQNVLFDHDDRRMPHIMFFAAENISPLQELTYHYNYSIGQVRDSQGNEKIKKCYCGSLECDGRLY
jgi:SAD/SRA domain/SET domain/Pre-SET motif